MTKEEILNGIKEMSVLELSELVKDLESEFGVSAAIPTIAAAAPAGAPAAATDSSTGSAEEEQSEFNVVLEEAGDNKINVIKAVREVTSLGLREAKELVEGAPKPIKEAVSKDEATQIQQKLQEAGAKVTIQ